LRLLRLQGALSVGHAAALGEQLLRQLVGLPRVPAAHKGGELGRPVLEDVALRRPRHLRPARGLRLRPPVGLDVALDVHGGAGLALELAVLGDDAGGVAHGNGPPVAGVRRYRVGRRSRCDWRRYDAAMLGASFYWLDNPDASYLRYNAATVRS